MSTTKQDLTYFQSSNNLILVVPNRIEEKWLLGYAIAIMKAIIYKYG